MESCEASAGAVNKQTLAVGMETVFSVDDFCNTDDLVRMIDSSEHQWYENDLQLAAELGKTLLERNKELEFTLRQQQAIVEDQALEIEYLSKQTTALREVGESRLKVYEQLEINLQELEKSHQKLQSESITDKKKIKSLASSVADLEQRCEQLQKLTDELSDNNWREKKYLRRKSSVKSSSTSGQTTPAVDGEWWSDDDRDELGQLQQKFDDFRAEMKQQQRFKEEMEVEMTSIIQENEQLRDQLISFKQRLPLELKDMESEFKLCHRCSQGDARRRLSDVIGVAGAELEEVEDEATSQQIGKCAVVKLNNGGTAYGNRDSLQSAGETLTEDEAETVKWSLLSELDTQYRILIEKYERMVNARQLAMEGSDKQVEETSCPSPSCSEDYRGLREQSWRPTEESSSLSSGFSEGDESLVHKSVQTDVTESAISDTLSLSSRLSHRARPKQSFDSYFQRTPEYKTIFREIFAVLKKSISYDETSFVDSFPVLTGGGGENRETDSNAAGQSISRRSYADVLMTGGGRRRQWLVRKSRLS